MKTMRALQFIFGLGNPGQEYAETRHNVGFMAEALVTERLGMPAHQIQKSLFAEVSKLGSVIAARPNTYMNKSGDGVRAVLHFYQKELLDRIEYPTIWVLHDDLDLMLGTYKIQYGVGPKIHNGLLSVYALLGSEKFWHVRIGIDGRNGAREIPASNYVVQPFSVAEKLELSIVLPEVAERVAKRILAEAS